MSNKIDIVIVNWNSGKLISECIDSFKLIDMSNFELNKIIIVDNGSTDDSINKIQKGELPTEIILNDKNVGFAKACNIGAKNSTADFLLMLNPDTKLFRDTLANSLQYMQRKDANKVGILGVKLVDEKGDINRNCARFPTPISMINKSLGLDKLLPRLIKSHFMNEWDHKNDRVVDQVMGSFLLIRRNIFETLNGYDERFFVYYEDLDLALRVKQLGFSSFYFSGACIFHKGGGTTEQIKARRLYYNTRSKIQYAEKHFHKIDFYFVTLFILFIEPFTRMIKATYSRNFNLIIEIYRGYKMLIFRYLFSKDIE